MAVLGRYLVRAIVAGTLVTLLVLLSLNIVFEFIDEAGDAGTGDYTVWTALLYVLLGLPYRAYESFPVATLIGALAGLGQLAARHELVAMRAAGVSIYQVARAVVVAGMALAIVAALLGEWLAPRAERLAQNLRSQAQSGQVQSLADGGFWLRDGARYVRIGRVPQPDVMDDVTVFERTGEAISRMIEAPQARYRDGRWRLVNARITRIGEMQISTRREPSLELESTLRPETLALVAVAPETLPIWELWRYIAYRERSGLEAERYRLAFWTKIATPLATMVMLLLTLPLVFGTSRSVGVGQQIFVGIVIGVVFFLGNRLLANIAIVYGLPAALAALAPSAVFLCIAIWAMRRAR